MKPDKMIEVKGVGGGGVREKGSARTVGEMAVHLGGAQERKWKKVGMGSASVYLKLESSKLHCIN